MTQVLPQYRRFKDDLNDIRMLSIALNASEAGNATEDNFGSVKDETKRRLLSTFNKEVAKFIETHLHILWDIWCEITRLDTQKIGFIKHPFDSEGVTKEEKIISTRKMYLQVNDSTKFMQFLANEIYPDSIKDDIKNLLLLDILDQLRNDYEEYTYNKFLEILPFLETIYGPKGYDFLLSYVKEHNLDAK